MALNIESSIAPALLSINGERTFSPLQHLRHKSQQTPQSSLPASAHSSLLKTVQHPGSRVVARASLFPRQPLYRGFTGSRPAVLHVATSAAAEDAFPPFAGEVSWLVACLLRAPSVWGSSNFSERAVRQGASHLPTPYKPGLQPFCREPGFCAKPARADPRHPGVALCPAHTGTEPPVALPSSAVQRGAGASLGGQQRWVLSVGCCFYTPISMKVLQPHSHASPR